MTLLMKQAEYAAHRGVKASAVSNWKAKGLLVFAADPERPGKQLVDVAKTDLVIGGTIDPTRGRPRSAEVAQVDAAPEKIPNKSPTPTVRTPDPYAEARLEEMRERTTRRRIENAQLVGQLVPLSEYERRAGDMGRLVRERTAGLIRKHAERLAAETDPRTIIAVLSEAFDKMFDKMASEIEAAATAELAADAALALAEPDEEDDEEADEPAEG